MSSNQQDLGPRLFHSESATLVQMLSFPQYGWYHEGRGTTFHRQQRVVMLQTVVEDGEPAILAAYAQEGELGHQGFLFMAPVHRFEIDLETRVRSSR